MEARLKTRDGRSSDNKIRKKIVDSRSTDSGMQYEVGRIKGGLFEVTPVPPGGARRGREGREAEKAGEAGGAETEDTTMYDTKDADVSPGA